MTFCKWIIKATEYTIKSKIKVFMDHKSNGIYCPVTHSFSIRDPTPAYPMKNPALSPLGRISWCFWHANRIPSSCREERVPSAMRAGGRLSHRGKVAGGREMAARELGSATSAGCGT